VIIPSSIASRFLPEQLQALKHSLELDPRPHYHHDPTKVYGLLFEGHDIHFKVEEGTLTVVYMLS
ncbi:MAG: tRNA (N6-threonylcarbamoyladenosine(37)-N6)-methyltransferase TrmO, partial [Prevotella sp.]|nr:tRNA (N6-threonylcarbamoyladenosine(37)-N6)-methyltransferase TrmO [Prevotella sp.]